MAPTGAVVNQLRLLRVHGVADDAGDRLAAEARRRWTLVIITSAAAPSLMLELDAAVIVPSFLNAGLSVGILSSLTLPGPSSMETTTSPARPFTVTGVISAAKAPDSVAALARLHAGDGEGVLRFARELVLGGAVLAEGAHGAAGLVGVFQAVEHHVVVDAVVAHADSRRGP